MDMKDSDQAICQTWKCLPISYIILPESAVWENTKINPTQLNIQFNRVTQTSQADFTLFSE